MAQLMGAHSTKPWVDGHSKGLVVRIRARNMYIYRLRFRPER